jgi:hypothetical protein
MDNPLPPLFLAPKRREKEEKEEEVDALVPWIAPRLFRPSAPDRGAVPGSVQPRDGALSAAAQAILARGALSVAGMNTAWRAYQFLVDVNSVPALTGLGQVKSLFVDVWIAASNSLAPVAGQLDVRVAVVRALVMLSVKKVLGIKQLGPVRETLLVLQVVSLAAAAIQSQGLSPQLVAVLQQISAVPILFYTAVARVVVDAGQAAQELSRAAAAVTRNELVELRNELSRSASGRLGKGGQLLVRTWSALLADSPDLAVYVQRHAAANGPEARVRLLAWSREMSQV